ncbi:hypothetical protein VNI00_006049 [Paramarasmius palmivorus]|uniref:Cytochrome P450 n=1 Tax=Paramarasmius palmivorus TaxID=297713 RepID=A0AAW0DD64_9AGAR
MATHPHVQKKAQEHIDDLLGDNCLPTLRDRPKLHYIEATMRECFRWRPVGPLAFPHSTLADDVVNGYFIPKGTAVFGNVWAMTRDTTVYPDPENFDPKRFLTEDGSCNNDNMFFTFGFGRRICPGRYFAADAIWIAIACILAVFDISKAKDEAGNDIELDNVEYTEGIAM